MELINSYIPSMYLNLFNMETMVFTKMFFSFQILWDDKYYLKIASHDAKCEIPEKTIQEIVSGYEADQNRIYPILNHSLRPMQLQLIDTLYAPCNVKRLETLLRFGGYIKKGEEPVAFFDTDTLTEDKFGTEKAAFYAKKTFHTAVEDLYEGSQSFVLYLGKDGILQFDTVCHNGIFLIYGAKKQETMQYLTQYENNVPALQIYRLHSAKANKTIQRLFCKKTL